MLFCRIGYFPAKQYEIPLVLFSIFRGEFFRSRVCSLYHGVGLFSLIFLKCKGVTVSKVLEKIESIVSVIIKLFCTVGYAEELR